MFGLFSPTTMFFSVRFSSMKFHQDYVKMKKKSQIQANILRSRLPEPGFFQYGAVGLDSQTLEQKNSIKTNRNPPVTVQSSHERPVRLHRDDDEDEGVFLSESVN